VICAFLSRRALELALPFMANTAHYLRALQRSKEKCKMVNVNGRKTLIVRRIGLRLFLTLAALVLLSGRGVFVAAAPLSADGNTAGVYNTGVYNVRDFGAKGDGTALDSPAINRAIDAASLAGGGTVRLPAGTYLSTSIHLKSNIALYLDQGATLEAASFKDPASKGSVIYDAPEPNPTAGDFQDFGHTHFHNSLIWGENLENVSILGPGRIWGKGLVSGEDHTAGSGNKSISLKLCRNVILRDFTIQHGGWFGILATGVDNLTIDNLKIDTNRDGMDIDSCRSVHVSNCSINSPHDDGLCLKSSYGLGFARATENVTITNCLVSGFTEGSVLDGTYQRGRPGRNDSGGTGRIKLGTESNGGFKNITISNCVFEYCRGLALETVDGGSLEDISISNITMRDIANAPIFLRLGSRLRGPAGTPEGVLRRINLSNFVIYNADSRYASILTGIPNHAIEDVTLSNIQIWYQGGGTAAQAAANPPEEENDYPEPERFGPMPAYGFFLRHVHGITLDNIQLHTLSPDARPAFVLDDVTKVRVINTDDFPAVQKATANAR
jgi:polygalacturonase